MINEREFADEMRRLVSNFGKVPEVMLNRIFGFVSDLEHKDLIKIVNSLIDENRKPTPAIFRDAASSIRRSRGSSSVTPEKAFTPFVERKCQKCGDAGFLSLYHKTKKYEVQCCCDCPTGKQFFERERELDRTRSKNARNLPRLSDRLLEEYDFDYHSPYSTAFYEKLGAAIQSIPGGANFLIRLYRKGFRFSGDLTADFEWLTSKELLNELGESDLKKALTVFTELFSDRRKRLQKRSVEISLLRSQP